MMCGRLIVVVVGNRYEQSDCLVGVHRNQDINSSKALTLDLRQVSWTGRRGCMGGLTVCYSMRNDFTSCGEESVVDDGINVVPVLVVKDAYCTMT